jgi:cardiolipin synthase
MSEPAGSPATSTTRESIVTIPNLMSAARLASVPVFVYLFVTGRPNAAVILYGVGAFTDFLDGYVARHTNSVTELGKLLDPFADRIFIVALAIALVARGALYWWLAVAIVGRDVLLLSLFPVLEGRGLPRIRVRSIGKTATAFLLFGLGWLALGETSFGLGTKGHDVGLPFVIAGAFLYWGAAIIYAREAITQMRELPRRGDA